MNWRALINKKKYGRLVRDEKPHQNHVSQPTAAEKPSLKKSPVIKPIRCCDHLGNIFDSRKALAAFWHIPESTLRGRLKRGMSIEAALTA